MGYVKTQADNALKAGNYKDAYTKCVITRLSCRLYSLDFPPLSVSVYQKDEKKKSAACV